MAFVIEDDVPAGRFVVEDDPVPIAKKDDKPWASGFEIANIAGGVIEPLAKMATGFVAKPVGEIAGMVSGLGDVISGGRLGGRNASEVSQDIQNAMTYAPKTQAGRSTANPLNFIPETISSGVQAVANPIANAVTGENPDPSSFRKMAGDAVREAIPQAANIGMVKAFPTAKTPAELAAKSYQDATRIDAAKMAVEKYGFSINPVVSNPSKPNSIRVAAGGHEYMDALSRRHNEPLTGEILKTEIGIPKETSLTSTAPFEAVREAAGQAKNQIQTMKDFTDDGTAASTINALTPKSTIGMSAVKASIKRQIKEANDLLEKTPTGAELIAEIETLRKAARKTYSMKEASQPFIDIADAKMGIANAFESMIERNLSLKGMQDLLAQYISGRKIMAKSYTLERATDFNTGIVDPMIIAKMTAKDNALDGAFADIGKITGNFPNSMSSKAGAAGGYKEFATTHATRTGAGGMAGYVIGGMLGQPLLGAALGGAAGEFGGRWYGNRLATNPNVQQAISVPKDYRMLTGETP